MKSKSEGKKRERQDWLLVLLILLIGFMCVLGAGQRALFTSSNWTMNANMESGIDPNKDFLTKPTDFFEPVDPAILTQPAWVRVFLTPGAKFVTGTAPIGPVADNNLPTQGQEMGTVIPTIIDTLPAGTGTAAPTNTFVWLPPPPATKTRKPGGGPPDTATNVPVINADLQVLQVSEVLPTTTYAAGTLLTYQVTVINNGPDAVTGAEISAPRPAQVSTWDWTCTPAAATCNGMSGAAPFSDIVNLPSGATIVYTVTATVPAGVNGNLTVAVSITPPAGSTDAIANNSFSDTNTPGVDLQIAKSHAGGNYTPGNPVQYTIDVTNNSTFAVNGVGVTDLFSTQFTSVSWSCAPFAGAPTCGAGTGDLNDTLNMPAGSVARYTITANTDSATWGTIANTASITTIPAGFTELNAGNNGDSDSAASTSGSNINVGPGDGNFTTPDSGDSVTMLISPAISGSFVFYERFSNSPTDTEVQLDMIQIEVSADGITWHPVFYWGDGTSDTNTNVALPVGGECPAETDNCTISSSSLYNSTGITIDIDSLGLNGSYPWVQITCPGGDSGDGCDIDAIEP